MEPVTWGVLAASTATWSVKKLASLAGGTAWKEKVEPAFKKSGLDHELALAYEASSTSVASGGWLHGTEVKKPTSS